MTKNMVGTILEIAKIRIREGEMADQDHLDHREKIRTGNQKDRRVLIELKKDHQVLIELEKDHLTTLKDLAKIKRCHETKQKLIETILIEHKMTETILIENKLTEIILTEHKLIETRLIEHKLTETSLTERKLIERG